MEACQARVSELIIGAGSAEAPGMLLSRLSKRNRTGAVIQGANG